MKRILTAAISLAACHAISLGDLRAAAGGTPSKLSFLPIPEDNLPTECQGDIDEYLDLLRDLPKCGRDDDELEAGDICEGGHGGGTSNRLNNCGGFDLYRVAGYDDDLHEESETKETFEWDDEDEDGGDLHDEDESEEMLDDEDEDDDKSDEGESGEDEETLDDDKSVEDAEEDDAIAPPQPTPEPTPWPVGPPTSKPIGPFTWPLYSQQCRDDAGPLFEDDWEQFGKGGKYHDSSKAIAVLKDGQCAGPVKDACEAHSNGGSITAKVARTAYLEGPLQCGGKGWFCRILPDPAHGGGDQSDWNYNHCNRTEYGDSDGHCHGSDNDDVYYWWVRDHWNRNYAGRLHCCCDWGSTLGVVSRCDYRAPLQPGENRQCRDANEDHNGPGSGFSKGFEAGCPNLGTTSPLPEPSDAQCWDVLNFAPGGNGR